MKKLTKTLRMMRMALIIALSAGAQVVRAQVTIGDNVAPQRYSILEIVSGGKGGLRLPQLTTDARNNFRDAASQVFTSNPKRDTPFLYEGLTIYNTDTRCIEYYNGQYWVNLFGITFSEMIGTDLTYRVPRPVAGETAVTFFDTSQYTGSVTWSNSLPGGKFDIGTPYTATIAMEAKPGCIFSAESMGAFFHNGSQSLTYLEPTDNDKGQKFEITIVFPMTNVPLPYKFSGDSNDDNSVIDLIRAGCARSSALFQIAATTDEENVTFNADTDLSSKGLVLNHDGSGSPSTTNNSPKELCIDGNGLVIDLTGSQSGAPLITVGSDVALTLKNITFKGLKSGDKGDGGNNNAPLVKVKKGGMLILDAGAIIADNNFEDVSGVHVEDGGKLIMNSGAMICGHNSSNSWSGVGVHVDGNGFFTMNGGLISKMDGGVHVAVGGFFTMNDGSISENETWRGGGGLTVFGQFLMNGGDISGNVAPNGGGVCLKGGIFVMRNGIIRNNESTQNGGGVFIDSNGTFDVELGTISGNEAKENGGGVFMEGGKFTLQRGNINDNMLTDINGAGAGVYVGYTSFSSNTGEYVSGTFDMAGGGIYHNHFDISNPYDSSIEAGNFFGCGVYVDDKGTFSKTGGTIYGIIKGGGGWENAPLMNFYDFEINTECYPGYMVYNDWINETQQKECEDEEKENFGTIDNARLPKHRGYAVYYKGTGNNVYSRDKTVGPECNLSMEELSGGGEDEYPTI